MATNIRLRRSAVQGNAPTTGQLDLGELAINTYDGKIYLKRTQGANTDILQLPAISTSQTFITNASSIGDLNDVDTGSITDGQVLLYYSANTTFAPGSISTSLAGLTDTDVSSASNGQLLQYISANNTWIAASTGTNGTGITNDQFTGTGSATQFTLTNAPNESEVIVFVGSVFQDPDTFNIAGTTLTFSTAPALNERIDVYIIGNASLFNTIEDSFTGNGSNTQYTLSYALSEQQALVTVNGIVQQPVTHYTMSGTTLTFDTAPAASDIIDVRYAIYGTTVDFANVTNKPDPTITLAGDASGSVTLTDLANGTLTVDVSSITGDVTVTGNVTATFVDSSLDGNIVIGAKNASGSDIAAGIPVYISGYVGGSGKVEITAAAANSAATMPAAGLTTTAINNGDEGYVVPFGLVRDLDTSAFSVGTVYVAPTGGLTATRPTDPTHLVQNVGKVAKVNASSGQILVLGPGRSNDVSNDISIPGNVAANNFVATTNVATVGLTANLITSNTFQGNLDWSYITSKPDPVVTVSLSGDVSGSGSATLTDLANGTISITTTVQGDSVALGTDTTGDYVESITGGTGVTVTGGTGEGSTPSIAIGQAVATTDDVTFNDITVTGNLVVSGTTTQVSAATLTIDDPIIEVGNNQSTPAYDLGFLGQRYASADATNHNVAFVWDESGSEFIAAHTANTANVTSVTVSAYANLQVASITATGLTATANVAAAGMTINSNDVATINDVIALSIALG